jgi:hypothetical protein
MPVRIRKWSSVFVHLMMMNILLLPSVEICHFDGEALLFLMNGYDLSKRA